MILIPQKAAGLYACIAARLLWGGTAWYLALSHTADAFELFYQRLLWAFVFCLVLCGATGSLAGIRRCFDDRRALLVSVAAALLISSNWFSVFWCIKHHQVLQASFGFFMAPMFTIVLGLVLVKEPLNAWSGGALLLCSAGVLALFLPAGQAFGWQVFLIAGSSTVYAYLRKRHPVPPMAGNLFETGVALVLWTLYAIATGRSGAPFGSAGDSLPYVLGIGVVTTVPMLLYVYSLKRTSLSLNAYLQYLSPTVMFLLGVLVLGESVEPRKLAGFALIWLSVACYLKGNRTPSAAPVRPSIPFGDARQEYRA